MRIRKIHDKGYEEGSGTVKDVGYKGTAVPAAAALAAAVFRAAGIRLDADVLYCFLGDCI